MSNVMTGKDEILRTIGNLDDLLMQYKEAYSAAEGMETPEDKVEEFRSMTRKAEYLMTLRMRLAKYLRDEYSIFVMNGWES